jgi:hypothetical protein
VATHQGKGFDVADQLGYRAGDAQGVGRRHALGEE